MVGCSQCGGLAELEEAVTWLYCLEWGLHLQVVFRRAELCSLLPRKAVWASVGFESDHKGTQEQVHSLCQSCARLSQWKSESAAVSWKVVMRLKGSQLA